MPSAASPLDRGAGDFPGGPVGKVSALPMLGTWVPSLAARSQMFCCSEKKKKIEGCKGLPDSPQNALPHMVILLSINKHLCVYVLLSRV